MCLKIKFLVLKVPKLHSSFSHFNFIQAGSLLCLCELFVLLDSHTSMNWFTPLLHLRDVNQGGNRVVSDVLMDKQDFPEHNKM